MPEKIALITGCSSGFGLVTSVELAKAGFRVVATTRNLERREALDRAASEARVSGRIDVFELDDTNFDVLPGFVSRGRWCQD